jgi:DNA-binding NtrC family response regulator
MDILPIAYHFLGQFNKNIGKKISAFDNEAVIRLMEYSWPGNVRQLRNIIERAVILCDSDKIAVKDLPLLSDESETEAGPQNIPATNEELKRAKKEIRQKAVRKIEKNFILNALMKNDWNISRAAESAGLQRTNFHSMMKKYGITLQKADPESK